MLQNHATSGGNVWRFMFSQCSLVDFRALTVGLALACVGMTIGVPAVATTSPTSFEVYAVGALREAMVALHAAFRAERVVPDTCGLQDAKFLFGLSGKLRERIEAGERPALFASVSPVHTKRADLFVTDCTNAKCAQRIESEFTFIEVPARFNVVANYRIGFAANASERYRIEFSEFEGDTIGIALMTLESR
jgi:hypothetical protein